MSAKKSKRRRQRRKLKSKEDRISNLPECLIQHILSFLPSTKEAIRTGVLSKQWKNQWTVVPVLTINLDDGKYFKNILKFYDCLKIEKFHFEYDTPYVPNYTRDLRFDKIVSFATSRHVEDLTLICSKSRPKCELPELVFNNVSLLKLRAESCDFRPKGKVNWARLKALNLHNCGLWDEAMEHILAGSPLLEYLEIMYCLGLNKLALTLKWLKIIALQGLHLRVLEISCPNLKELSICYSRMIDQPELAIASESLKSLHVGDVKGIHSLQVSCTKLETLELYYNLELDKVELMNLPSSVYVILDFTRKRESSKKGIYERLVRDILQQLHHVYKLKLGRWLVEVLSGLEAREMLSPLLQTKLLILYDPGREEYESGMAWLLHNLPMLKLLMIYEKDYKWNYFMKLTDFQEKHPNLTVFNFPASHLKTIVIFGSKVFLSSPIWSLPAIGVDDYEMKTEKAIKGGTRMVIRRIKF